MPRTKPSAIKPRQGSATQQKQGSSKVLAGALVRRVGRPSNYQPEFVQMARKVAELGGGDLEVAAMIGCSSASLYRWKTEHPEFREAFISGRAQHDDLVERSLLHRALGYSRTATKVISTPAGIVNAEYVEHVPPDVSAAIFWLKNRRPEAWRDSKDVTVRRAEGLTEEQARAMAEAMIAAASVRSEPQE